MFLNFKKKPRLSQNSKKRAVVFVDFEHWYISLDKFFGKKPNIRAWRDMLAKEYNVVEMLFFGDFSNPALRFEIPKIREVSNTIIETQNGTAHYKKDFTDFILLDHMYQRAMDSEGIDCFILFSGDGHFASVASFLVNKCRKEVIVYGIRDCMSMQLKNSATASFQIPSEEEIRLYRLQAVVSYIRELYEKKPKSRPTFLATSEGVAKHLSLPKEEAAALMRELIEKEYLYQVRMYLGRRVQIKVIRVNNEKIDSDKFMEQ